MSQGTFFLSKSCCLILENEYHSLAVMVVLEVLSITVTRSVSLMGRKLMFTLLSNCTTMVYSLKKTIHFVKLITFALFMNAIYTYVLSAYLGASGGCSLRSLTF